MVTTAPVTAMTTATIANRRIFAPVPEDRRLPERASPQNRAGRSHSPSRAIAQAPSS